LTQGKQWLTGRHGDISLDTAISLKRVTLIHPPYFDFLIRKTAALIVISKSPFDPYALKPASANI
jgi:hypothetical protein